MTILFLKKKLWMVMKWLKSILGQQMHASNTLILILLINSHKIRVGLI